MHIPAVQVLDRMLRYGWPTTAVTDGLAAEAQCFVPHVMGEGAKAVVLRDFLTSEISADREGVLARLSFLRSACRDVALFGDLIFADPEAFMAQSETFSLFNYGQAVGVTEACIEATKPWVDYVSNLTRAEAPILVPLIDIPAGSLVLEPGGNSGVFARALIKARRPLRHVVMDLPAVCELGRRRGIEGGLSFVAADMLLGDWRRVVGFEPEVVLFKSVLHDWPEAEAEHVLNEAIKSLSPYGQIIIAERSAFRGMVNGTAMDYANLVFAAFYREPEVYRAMLHRLCADISVSVEYTMIDMQWFVLTARRRA